MHFFYYNNYYTFFLYHCNNYYNFFIFCIIIIAFANIILNLYTLIVAGLEKVNPGAIIIKVSLFSTKGNKVIINFTKLHFYLTFAFSILVFIVPVLINIIIIVLVLLYRKYKTLIYNFIFIII